MRPRRRFAHSAAGTIAAPVLALAIIVACDGVNPAQPRTAAALTLSAGHGRGAHRTRLGVERCAPGQGEFSVQSTNRWFPMPVGRQWVYTGEEDGTPMRLQITVLDRTRTIAGVVTRVIEEREWEDGALLEVSWNYYAQAADGTICYFGEDVDIHERGGISHEGAWCASGEGNAPGIFVPGNPQPGMRFRMEVAPGVAEDEGLIVGSGPTRVPFGTYRETLRIREHNPLDGDTGHKIFAANVGLIVDGPLELIDVRTTSGTPEQPIPTEQTCGV